MSEYKSEIRDGMRIDWDVPIEMDDSLVLRADVYRPVAEGEYPIILSYGPYGKWLAFPDRYESQWKRLVAEHPDVAAGSTNKYQNWEVVDPEKWVPDGYVCVRVDSRGAGRSPGFWDLRSPRENQDLYDCIEWAAVQPWSNGKVGLNGISYYASNQWRVACLEPPHLTAMCIWEGTADRFRDGTFHGGIYCTFSAEWYKNRAKARQHGYGTKGYRSSMNGEWISGPETLSEEELGENRADSSEEIFAHPLDDEYWEARRPDFSKIKVPFLSAGNWGGQGLHPRGNIEGFLRSASEEKWLEMHGLEHWTHFYTDYGVALQKKFLGHYLKGEDTGWKEQPKVLLQVRHPGGQFVERGENEWPLARTNWTKFYLHPGDHTLSMEPGSAEGGVSYKGFGDGVTFITPPLEEETEITGPAAAKLFVSSETEDADIFLVLRVFAPDFTEVTFQGSHDPNTPAAQGWLRASHRKLNEELSTEYQPYHTHDEKQPLTPGEVYELDVEIWPTSVVVPAGHRLGLSVRGKDYVGQKGATSKFWSATKPWSGVGPFWHDDPRDRPADVFGGKVTLHMGSDWQAYVLLPIIPPK